MNVALDLAQFFNGLALLTLLTVLAPSFARLLIGRARQPLDPLWSIIWFMAAHQFGYFIRWWQDMGHVPVDSKDAVGLLGLRVMSAMIAWALVHRRVVIEGWRW